MMQKATIPLKAKTFQMVFLKVYIPSKYTRFTGIILNILRNTFSDSRKHLCLSGITVIIIMKCLSQDWVIARYQGSCGLIQLLIVISIVFFRRQDTYFNREAQL